MRGGPLEVGGPQAPAQSAGGKSVLGCHPNNGRKPLVKQEFIKEILRMERSAGGNFVC